MKVLVVNAGSSSVKCSLVDTDSARTLSNSIVERIGIPGTRLKAVAADGRREERECPRASSAGPALEEIARALTSGPAAVLADLGEIEAVGHRVVQGGPQFTKTVVIDERAKAAIRELCPLAPLHNPANLAGIEAAERLLPGRPQAAVFDTAFHATIPPKAHLYGLPLAFASARRLRRYGFHGTSHRYVSERCREMLGRERARRLVTAHIGNGVSLTAVLDGRSVDTTMGFTPLEGVVMGTRSGSVDPALVLFLVEGGMAPKDVDRLLNKESGLLGMAGIGSGDLRDVLAARDKGNESAATAFDVYVYRIAVAVGALAVALGGLDALAFTAGAGENSPPLRAAVASYLAHLGVELDPAKNDSASGDCDISAPEARCRTLVVRTQEDLLIARETARAVSAR